MQARILIRTGAVTDEKLVAAGKMLPMLPRGVKSAGKDWFLQSKVNP